MIYEVTAKLNRREDGGFFHHGYRDGDPLEDVATFTIEADHPAVAAEVVFRIGNLRDVGDLEDRRWPERERSLSVGDVLEIIGADGEGFVMACKPVGWE